MLKKRPIVLLFTAFMLSIVTFGCSNQETGHNKDSGKRIELTISAAASLQDALNEIKTQFEKEHKDIKIIYNFGGSGALQQQIIQGAPVDLFFSAAEDKFNQLEEKGFIQKESSKNLIGNEIVLVVPKNSKIAIQSFTDLKKANKISIGTPEAVPAGKYAKETLEALKLWKTVEANLVYAKDVRQVLTFVETGNVDAGIVYKTDALTSKKIVIASNASDDLHTPIIYPVGVLKENSHPKEAMTFYEYLQNEESLEIFIKYGFKKL